MQILGEYDLSTQIMQVWWQTNKNPRVVVAGNFGTPWHALKVLDDALSSYRLWSANFQNHEGFKFRSTVTPETVFIGPAMRGQPNLQYYPMRLALAPRMLFHETKPDIVLIHTTPIDPETGKVSLGIECNVLPAAIRACHENGGIVIAQINADMPYTYGDSEVDPSDIDFGLRWDEILPSPKPSEPTDTDQRIAANLLPLIPEGATLQGGIGPVVDTVLGLVADRPLPEGAERYHVWTEMFGDWAMKLAKAGLLEPYIVGTFAFGSQEFYEWLDHNPAVRMYETTTVNDPAEIAKMPNFISVNTASEVDLFGQANGGYIKGQFWSGFGGQTDFVQGASHSVGGLAIIALASMHPRAKVSTIVTRLHGPATSIQPSYVVTENGAAKIQGETARQQAENLIKAAHPTARDDLREEARIGEW